MFASKSLSASVIAVVAVLVMAACSGGSGVPGPDDHAEGPEARRGRLISMQLLATASHEETVAAAAKSGLTPTLRAPDCGIKVYSLLYDTVGVWGEAATVSAAMVVPDGCPGPYPMMSLALGTRVQAGVEAASVVRTPFAGYGYVIVMSDYLGLGRSAYPFHPYLHADSEATAIIDGMRAARQAAVDAHVPLSSALLMTGSSQGGHSVLAALRAIESDYSDEFQPTAVMASSGPYALERTFVDGWQGMTKAGPNPLASILFSYTLKSYQKVYKNIYEDPSEVFKPPFDALSEKYFPGPEALFSLMQSGQFPMPDRLESFRQPEAFEAFTTDPMHPFRVALRKNELLNWTPKAPLLLCGSSGDTVVSFDNSIEAYSAYKERGATVTLLDTKDQLPPTLNGLEHHAAGGGTACTIAALSKVFEPVRAASLATDSEANSSDR